MRRGCGSTVYNFRYNQGIFSGLRFDLLMYRYAFHHIPAKPGRFYFLLALGDLFNGPYLPVWNMMQCCNDARTARLPDIQQANRVIRTIPAHGLLQSENVFGRFHSQTVKDR
jgi:hypothetical protein